MLKYELYKEKICKHKLFNSSENLSDFWFENKDEIQKDIPFNIGESDLFGKIVRWESEIGKICTEEIRKYLKNKVNSVFIENTHLCEISFTDFAFLYQGKSYTLQDFSNIFPTSKINGKADLIGVNLENIQIYNACIINCMFYSANFNNSDFQDVTLVETSFLNSSFKKARLVMIKAYNGSTLSGINVSGSYVHAIVLDEAVLGINGMEFTEISYFKLLWWSCFNIFSRLEFNSKGEQTTFYANSISQGSSTELIKFIEYVKWFQYVYKMLHKSERLPLSSRIGFFFEVLTTKYWRSFSVLGCFSLILNLIFATIYLIIADDFNNGTHTFLGSFYYSIVTFTTLGYGDIFPKTDIARMIVTVEVLMGYVILGLFVFLLSKKIDAKF
ncbi:voltage-gated potassium channel [Chryseobacterium nakagawai]|uniref:Potassium channel domain-containing protein n=1 Tax=Chryseobacterium nakagawai TaxID=1241982 RepID=A0AAD1DQV1_CHRNA|nr:ion channel [Chryseobacterium nakagawai]AZA91772.1 hypothetical protein EG343_14680 [Chryseobacterium nakagawai]VEH18282.1 voltage-gated potassium channel [Chryseobacterium nakagawai]